MSRESALAGTLRPAQLLSIGIGAIMGVGWAVVLGDWLSAAGPGGTVLGFVLGGACLVLVAACYAELAGTMPLAGGEVVYLGAIFGPLAAFLVGWFLVLMAIAITSFEAISLAWFIDQLFPEHQGSVAYRVLGVDVRTRALVIGAAGVLLVGGANYLGARATGRVQEAFTYVKALAIIAFVIAALIAGNARDLQPLLPPKTGRSAAIGVLWIAATTPLWLGGFQVVPQAIEERSASTTVATVGRLTVLSVVLGVLFYCCVVAASATLVPWQHLVRAPLPAVLAVSIAFPSPPLAQAVLLAIILGILATWNATFLWATRLLLALGRAHLVPGPFAHIGRFRSPTVAVLFVATIGLIGAFLGRGALLPIVGMSSMSLTVAYAFTCAAALRQRRLRPQLARPFRVPGGTLSMRVGVVASALMGAYGLLEPWIGARGVPIEWVLLAIWSALGMACWAWMRRMARDRRTHSPR